MSNKGTGFALAMLAPMLALVRVSAIAGPGDIVVQGRNRLANAQVGGAHVYECVESDGRSVCKFRLLSMLAPARRL